MSVSQEILYQIIKIDPMATFAWGIKEITHGKNRLTLKTSGLVKWKGYVQINYNEVTDLYDIEFFRVRGNQLKVDSTVYGVFCEDLVRIIDEQVG